VLHKINSDNDEELHHVMNVSREEAEYARLVREQGERYKDSGGSSQQQGGGGLLRMLKRSISRKAKAPPMQTRIDTRSWTMKSNLTFPYNTSSNNIGSDSSYAHGCD
jgi:hypothetical protein